LAVSAVLSLPSEFVSAELIISLRAACLPARSRPARTLCTCSRAAPASPRSTTCWTRRRASCWSERTTVAGANSHLPLHLSLGGVVSPVLVRLTLLPNCIAQGGGWSLESLQVYKFVYACLLIDFGHGKQALQYVDVSVPRSFCCLLLFLCSVCFLLCGFGSSSFVVAFGADG
jgi:hypothetical protein